MTTVLTAIPQFLRYLSGLPDADGVVNALVRGPLAPFGVTRATFLARAGDELISIYATGYTPDLVSRFAHFPADVDLPSTRAIHGPTRLRVENLLDEFPVLRLDALRWRPILQQNGPGDVIGFPVMCSGETIAVMTVLTADRPGNQKLPDELLAALGSILGLWWSHPLTPRERVAIMAQEDTFTLTDRQREILLLVEQGLSTAKIAAQMGYSESTVKQQAQRAMQVLRVSDRKAAVARARELGLLS